MEIGGSTVAGEVSGDDAQIGDGAKVGGDGPGEGLGREARCAAIVPCGVVCPIKNTHPGAGEVLFNQRDFEDDCGPAIGRRCGASVVDLEQRRHGINNHRRGGLGAGLRRLRGGSGGVFQYDVEVVLAVGRGRVAQRGLVVWRDRGAGPSAPAVGRDPERSFHAITGPVGVIRQDNLAARQVQRVARICGRRGEERDEDAQARVQAVPHERTRLRSSAELIGGRPKPTRGRRAARARAALARVTAWRDGG